uniref:Fibronectin type-III domain-containing protein n=1 Tax=Timema shepardi TaxID=629360 RepID=A0A7R9G6G5_TIMSH|nr:unnamed protein product [Timema shepardi]
MVSIVAGNATVDPWSMLLQVVPRHGGEMSRPAHGKLRALLLLCSVGTLFPVSHCDDATGNKCPSFAANPSCACYNFEDGLFLECPGASPQTIRSVLDVIATPVKSLSVYDFDKTVTTLSAHYFPPNSIIRHLQITHSNLHELKDDSLSTLSLGLESLSIVSGKLDKVPQKALSGLTHLRSLDLESNEIQELPSYSFYGLSLVKLNMKGNVLHKISEYGFAGLEGSLTELDLAENKLKLFPMTALRRLEHLRSLRMAWNEIGSILDDGYSRLDSLLFLDLSSNNFETIPRDCFRPTPVLRTLSLYYNAIETVHSEAFVSLTEMESVDVSHNKIVFLDPFIFQMNKKLRTVDLSHNHIHYISGVFSKLPELRELFLSENNILEIPSDAFSDSSLLTVVYLQQNAIRWIEQDSLITLPNLSQLHLSANFIQYIPKELFFQSQKLSSLSLDDNRITGIDPGTFEFVQSLRELRLQNNRIISIARGVFDPLPSLLELHLQNNLIATIESGSFRSLQSLQHVNLQGNLLTTLGDVFLHESPSLVSIQLDSNSLVTLHNDSLRGQSSVQIMWLGHNRLVRVDRTLFSDLLLIQRVYLTNNSISHIEDRAFEPMQALKFLDLSLNRLKHISKNTFAELHELEELYLSGNCLQFIDPKAMTSLKKLRNLDLSDNRISVLHDDIFQEGLPIRVLSLKNCSVVKIESGAFQGLNNLNELNLEDNLLNAASLRQLDIPGLRALAVSGNNFSNIQGNSLDGLPSLQTLVINNAQIHKLPKNVLSKNKDLMRLELSENHLKQLGREVFMGLKALKELRLHSNSFLEIPYGAFTNMSALEVLVVSMNSLTSVDLSKLNGLPRLRELDLHGNTVSSLSGFASANLSHLLNVDLSENSLAALPANFFHLSSHLIRLDLASNRFRQIPTIALSEQNLPGLAWLNLTANPLSRIHDLSSVRRYPNLQEIHISGTNLTIVTSKDFEAFPSLLHLFLDQNRISRVSPGAFRSLPNLLTLDIGVNEIEMLPQERLQGLNQLRLLNITHNRLKELEEFPPDLKSLQILDLSFNQVTRVGKWTFRFLVNLAELHLYGNWISSVASDSFRPLKKLRVLDLSKNYLENLPLSAFRPLETQIRSLRTQENPLHCGCDSQELWEWLRDHQKLLVGVATRGLRCEHPPELRGLVFLDLEPPTFCSTPLVLKLAIQDIQPFSVLVSWQSRNHSGLHGYKVAYLAVDSQDTVRGKLLERGSRSVKLGRLIPGTRYLICVVGLGNWGSPRKNSSAEDVLSDSPTTRCTEVRTLEAPDSIVSEGPGLGSSVGSLLTRRLGLIVGSCMGFIVFVVLVSVLGYMKLKKRRDAAKREQPIPPEYISYRHFSIQSGEAGSHPLAAVNFTTSLNSDPEPVEKCRPQCASNPQHNSATSRTVTHSRSSSDHQWLVARNGTQHSVFSQNGAQHSVFSQNGAQHSVFSQNGAQHSVVSAPEDFTREPMNGRVPCSRQEPRYWPALPEVGWGCDVSSPPDRRNKGPGQVLAVKAGSSLLFDVLLIHLGYERPPRCLGQLLDTDILAVCSGLVNIDHGDYISIHLHWIYLTLPGCVCSGLVNIDHGDYISIHLHWIYLTLPGSVCSGLVNIDHGDYISIHLHWIYLHPHSLDMSHTSRLCVLWSGEYRPRRE